jgi:hypothetical protein
MTEPNTAATPEGAEPAQPVEGVEGAEQGPPPAATYTPPATQADLDRIIFDRVTRTKNQFKDYTELKAAKAELDQIKAQNQTAEQRQAEELTRWQSEAEKWRTASVGSRIEALAALDFADPSDASGALADPGKYLDAGGQIDENAIRADLADVLERKPHWRRPEGASPPRAPAPNPAQGSGGGRPAADPAGEFAAIIQSQLQRG